MVIERAWMRWLVAAGVFGVATWLNLYLQPLLDGRAPLLPFFPALVVVGLACGFGPAMALLIGSCAAVLYFWIPPIGQLLPIDSLADVLLMALFFLTGLLVGGVAASAGSLMKKDRRSRRRLQLALNAARMVTWDLDISSGVVTVSGGAQEIFGQGWTSVDDLLAIMTSEDAKELQGRYRAALHDGGRFSHTAAINRPDNGHLVWVRVDGEVVADAKGRAVHVYGVVADVTPQQQALRASQAAEERFQLALESGKVMAWECNEDARYTWVVNAPAGVPVDTLIGAEVGSVARQPDFAAAVRDAIATGRPANLSQLASHGGREFQLLTSIRPVRSGDGKVHRVLGATVDITELTQAQAQLLVESQRKDNFLATLAHELRNPMAPIRYAVATLLRSDDAAGKQRAAEIISRQSAHMSRLIDDLLDMSRITRNAVDLQREPIDLRSVVRQALEAVEPIYVEKQHRISLSMPPQAIIVHGDATRLQQVLGNLLDNAAKYSPVPGEVQVDLTEDSGHATVTITDRGIGIAKELQPRVFELFSRLDASNSAPSGLGIGLAVSRQLVLLHGGTIEVESEGTGYGSRFVVSLPLATVDAPSAPRDDPAKPASAAIVDVKVLVVDDNVDGADSLAILLRQAGFQVSVAYSGSDACDQFERLHPRVVLLDIGLPDISGIEVARRIRSTEEEIALIALTGWGQQSDRDSTAAAGFDAHLVKPVDFSQLDRLIRQLVPGSEQQRGR